MPMPTEERVSQLVAGPVERRGLDLEGVTIVAAGPARVQVTVDSDEGVDLDAIAELSSDISTALDDAGDFGETPYLLEVTTPGVDRPLTAPRHWRRARGRKVRVALRPDAAGTGTDARFEARVGPATETEVALVPAGRRKPHLVTVPLADIDRAVVQVEFSPPSPAELALTGIAPGRPEPGAAGADLGDAGPGDPDLDGEEREAQPEAAAPTEGIVE
ncbi:ribosome maturation factor RimP [Nocardia sp. alder85J]|uniref:ribosome maturation factor RimP n=1 Tax=Nocardia sp. alder85J TaxID=2862949 RepID=UPI001CD5D953|nr:ribosome maturation factor RimP [Nocardia sp. alder85J]MCX4094255.1 ribosome maturation factor RimP [Nocardia sp. alder85J]